MTRAAMVLGIALVLLALGSTGLPATVRAADEAQAVASDIAVVEASAVTAAASSSATTSGSQGSVIVFQVSSGGAISAVNPDGSNQHVLLPASALGDLKIQYQGMDERVISWR